MNKCDWGCIENLLVCIFKKMSTYVKVLKDTGKNLC